MTVKKKTTAKKKTATKQQLIHHDPFEEIEASGEKADQQPQSDDATASSQAVEPQQQSFDLGLSLTIEDVERQKKALMALIVEGVGVHLDGENVEQVDGAGLQLLAAFFREVDERELEISWAEVSKPLYEAVQLVGLKDALNMQAIEIQDDGEGTAWGLF